MGKKTKKKKKHGQKQNKNDLPIFDSDQDFLRAFNKEGDIKINHGKDDFIESTPKNKHGMPVINPLSNGQSLKEDEVDFAELLEESFKKQRGQPAKKPSPVPVKKRLKRYPPVEAELDLHGYNAIGAQVKTRTFIISCKLQGFFTLRIIVGKGLHSDLGPVLPDVVEDVLKEMKKQGQVIFYEWDKKNKRKSGALIVYLKQFEQFE